jgi:hypothetical protein
MRASQRALDVISWLGGEGSIKLQISLERLCNEKATSLAGWSREARGWEMGHMPKGADTSR